MKRIATWLLSTITVLVLLFGYHTSTSTSFGSDSVVATPVETTRSGSSTSTSSSSSSSSSGSGSSGSASSSKTFTGPSVDTQWGPVQVAITVANGKITAVTVPVYPNGNGKDQEINAYALPILADEAVKAQSANIDMVSGATVTSTGYLKSLQSAIDEANL
ncbi:MAG: hypothetical protein QOJ72_2629 [Nocardioidaceae bacterium]|jgi:uncharacterized protein with FMN-binding domain|nr:hypothetical protein [Nocardioidaceae bacterium]